MIEKESIDLLENLINRKKKTNLNVLTYLGLHSFHLIVSFSFFSLNHFQMCYFSRYFSSLFSAPLYRYGVLPFSLFYFSLSSHIFLPSVFFSEREDFA